MGICLTTIKEIERERKNEAHWVPAVRAYECTRDGAFARQVAPKMPSKMK